MVSDQRSTINVQIGDGSPAFIRFYCAIFLGRCRLRAGWSMLCARPFDFTDGAHGLEVDVNR